MKKIRIILIWLVIAGAFFCNVISLEALSPAEMRNHKRCVYNAYEYTARVYNDDDNWISSDNKYMYVHYVDYKHGVCICGVDVVLFRVGEGYEKFLFDYD